MFFLHRSCRADQNNCGQCVRECVSAPEDENRANDCDGPAAGGREEARHAVQDQQPPQILPQHHYAGDCLPSALLHIHFIPFIPSNM